MLQGKQNVYIIIVIGLSMIVMLSVNIIKNQQKYYEIGGNEVDSGKVNLWPISVSDIYHRKMWRINTETNLTSYIIQS
jgi:hypothetical protein